MTKMGSAEFNNQRISPFFKQLFAVTGVVLYMIGTGANIAYPGVLLQQLRQSDSDVTLTTEHESWIASSLGLALILGILTAPLLLQRLGRKVTNQISILPSLGGWALLMTAKSPEVLLASRVLQGFGMGIQAACAPVTIAEYSSPENRGAFLATIAFSFASGMLLAHVSGTVLHWRPAALCCGSVYAISLIFITLSPETPPYLASKGLNKECRRSFRWLRGNDQKSQRELETLLNSQKKEANEIAPKISTWERYKTIVLKPEFYKPTCIMMFMFVLFQVSGMTVVPSYTVPMMDYVTAKTIESYTSMLVVDVVRFITACLGCVVVNKFPRRTVLFTGIIVTVVSLYTTAVMIYLRDAGYIPEDYHWLPIIPALCYIFGKTLGILPIPWAIAGEIFPLAYRSIGSGISGSFLSIMFFVVVKTAPNLFELIGFEGVFCLYGTCVAVCGFFLYVLLPETKGKTLYEIECHFKGVNYDAEIGNEMNTMLDAEER